MVSDCLIVVAVFCVHNLNFKDVNDCCCDDGAGQWEHNLVKDIAQYHFLCAMLNVMMSVVKCSRSMPAHTRLEWIII